MRRRLHLLSFFALPALLAGQTADTFPCEAPPEIRTAFREAGRTENRNERIERMKELAARHPDDLWVQRMYIEATRSETSVSGEVLAQTRERHEARPDDPAAAFLYAHCLTGRDTPRAIPILTVLTEKTPAFPLPWLALAHIYGSPNFRDPAKMQTYAEGYIDRCPDAGDAANLAGRLDKSDKLAAIAKALRARIAGKADEETVPLYRVLWTLEFKLAELPEHPRIREQVAEDMKFLTGLDREKIGFLNFVLQEGYKLTGDSEGQRKLAAEAKTPGDTINAFFQASSEWSKANPSPTDPAERETRRRKRLEFLDEWIARLSDHDFVRLERLRNLAELRDTPDDVLVEEGDRVLDASRKPPQAGIVVMSTTPAMQVAAIWARRGVELERVPAVLAEGLEALEKQNERRSGPPSDLYDTGPEQRLMRENDRWFADVHGWQTLAMAYAKSGRSAEARSILAKWDTALRERRRQAEELRKKHQAAGPAQGPDRVRTIEESLVSGQPHAEAQYYEALAQLAAAEQRKLDALVFYQAGLRARGGAAGMPPLSAAPSDPQARAGELWKELGGTQEGWQAWLESVKDAGPGAPRRSRWSEMNRAIPEFTATDQGARTWTVADLKGKTTLINVWATWCGPCRAELPYIQKLHEQVKDREVMQVITLSIDENLGLVAPFLEEHGYTFPVLLAKAFVDSFSGPLPVPTNWIADRAGTLRLEAVGFGGDGEEWLKQALERMEAVRGGP